jgi:hypothetical protein
MAVQEHPMQALAAFLPANSFERVVTYIHYYKVHLTVTKKRKTVLGDYRHSLYNRNHRISINGNLNNYEFLITLLHELAHLLTYEQFKNKVPAHGKEWKIIYGKLLEEFMALDVFPTDIVQALRKTIHNPAATANGETDLIKVLRSYNKPITTNLIMVEQVPLHQLFKTTNGKTFKKGEKRRKLYLCQEVSTGKMYLFNPITEVVMI